MEAHDEINTLVGDIWSSVLGLSAEPAPSSIRVEEPRLTGFVHIQGDWQGTVTVDCPVGLAATAAAAMFGMALQELTQAEIDDALGEITNMTGGGIKSMLPGSCSLSLPTVIEGVGFKVNVPGTVIVDEATYAAGGSWMTVRVLEQQADVSPAHIAAHIAGSI